MLKILFEPFLNRIIYLKERSEGETVQMGLSFICCLTPQMSATFGPGPGWIQEVEIPSWSPTWQHGTRDLGHEPLLSQVQWQGAGLETKQSGIKHSIWMQTFQAVG